MDYSSSDFNSDDIGKHRCTERQPGTTLKLPTEPDDSYSKLLKPETRPLDLKAGEWTILPRFISASIGRHNGSQACLSSC
jgi:hypothetical protein